MSAWALAGAGTGELTLTPDGKKPMPTDITMRMGAVGFKGRVLGEPGEDTLVLNVKSDAMWVGTKNEKTPDMVATEGDVTRLRVTLEGRACVRNRRRGDVHSECRGGTATGRRRCRDRHRARRWAQDCATPQARSPSAQDKARRKRTASGEPVHSFRTLLDDLATVANNRVVAPLADAMPFDLITRPTALQCKAFKLLGVRLERTQ